MEFHPGINACRANSVVGLAADYSAVSKTGGSCSNCSHRFPFFLLGFTLLMGGDVS